MASAGAGESEDPSPTLSVSAFDQFSRWAAGNYGVDTSSWTYQTSACVLWDDVIAKSKTSGVDLTVAQVEYILGPSSNTGYTLRTQQNMNPVDPDAVDELVSAGDQCADYIAARE